MADESSSGSSRSEESDAERALKRILPKAAQFQERFKAAMQARETGFVRLEVKFSVGRATAVLVSSSEESDLRS